MRCRRRNDHASANPAFALPTAKTRRGRRNPRLRPRQRPLADAGRRCGPAEGFSRPVLPAHPSLETDPSQKHPDLFREVIARMGKGNVVVVAMPDQLHYMVLEEAIRREQHICCVKPLVLRHDQALEIERRAYEKGLVVGVEYHKRLDDRALLARRQYREGLFGEFKLGHAEMNEPYSYRHSNFMNWCICENSDMFTLCRLPLRGPGAFHHRPVADFVVGVRHRRLLSERQPRLPLDQRACCGKTAPA